MKQRPCNIFMVELPPPTEEELAEARRKTLENDRPDDDPERTLWRMDLIAMNNAERVKWMRHAMRSLMTLVKSYSSLDDFAKDKEEWFA